MFRNYRLHDEYGLVTINLAQIRYITWGNGLAYIYLKEGLLITPEATRLQEDLKHYNDIQGYGSRL